MANPISADEIARSLSDEIVREHVVGLLDQRWRKDLTLVAAPGGYGKTRALAQAVRSNEEDPVGVEFYVRLRPAHIDPTRLAVALLDTLGGHDERLADEASLVERILDQFAAMSPTNVCLIVDDVHLIAASQDAVEVLNDVIRLLPTNSHILLAGRRIPELPLARLRADDAVIEVTEDDLVFGEAEIDLLVERHGVDKALLTPLAGWPALIRLAVVAGKAGPQQFLMQEIIDDLAPEVLRALTVATLAGSADQDVLGRCGIEITPEQLADRVPLIDVSPANEARPHDLWSDVIAEIVDPAHFGELTDVIAPWHSEHWRHDEAIVLAAAHGSPELSRRVLMEALDASDLRLHAASTGRWLKLYGGSDQIEPDDAELRLLRGWHERLSKGPGHGDDDVTAALELFRERGDSLGEARASVEHAFRGFLAGDVGPVLDAVKRSPRLVKSGITFLQPLGEMTNAIIAELSGDFDRALEHSMRAIRPGVRREFAELTLRHRTTLNFLVGDGDGAIETAKQLVAHSPTPANDLLLVISRFANGDLGDLPERWSEIRYHETGNVREDYIFATASVFIDACLGLTPRLDKARATAWDRPRERMQLALCEWCADIIAGNEAQAHERLQHEIAELGLEDALVVGEVRRFLVSCYVGVPAVRAYIDRPEIESDLGPYHLDRLALARILLALREGTPPNWAGYVGPECTISAMSLPWSAEIACGLVMVDEVKGLALADGLFKAAGSRAQTWLRACAASGGPHSVGANQLLRMLPAPPASPTRILTQPAVSLERNGHQAPVSRVRVRQLLLLLVLRESITRDTAMTLLWPDKDIDKARNNLRITLSHLRDDLEPDRRSGEPSYHLRQRGDTISLHRSVHLRCDLWQIRDSLAAAEAAHLSGDRASRLVALGPVASLWQPPLLPDLIDVTDLGSEVGALQARLRDGAVEVAEAHVSAGRYDEAELLGRKLLRQDEFDERAHAIVIASYLGTGHDGRARQAIDDCLAMLSELDVTPAAATRMLLRRAQYPEDATRRSA